jgi:hypothetical protein
MDYMPLVESMDQLDGGPLGDSHFGVLFGNIKSAGMVQYTYLFIVYKKGEELPLLIVASEVNGFRDKAGGGSHFLGLFDGSGHANLGDSDEWGDVDKFRKALKVVEKQLGVRPSGGDAHTTAPPLNTTSIVGIFGALTGVVAVCLFMAARWYGDLIGNAPVPGPEPVEPTSPSNDLLMVGIVCGVIALTGVVAIGWSFCRALKAKP